jgi:hypothetical protein
MAKGGGAGLVPCGSWPSSCRGGWEEGAVLLLPLLLLLFVLLLPPLLLRLPRPLRVLTKWLPRRWMCRWRLGEERRRWTSSLRPGSLEAGSCSPGIFGALAAALCRPGGACGVRDVCVHECDWKGRKSEAEGSSPRPPG